MYTGALTVGQEGPEYDGPGKGEKDRSFNVGIHICVNFLRKKNRENIPNFV